MFGRVSYTGDAELRIRRCNCSYCRLSCGGIHRS